MPTLDAPNPDHVENHHCFILSALRPVWDTFPRVLGHYVRDAGVFDLDTAIRRMTSMQADRFGLKGRGRIAEGQHPGVVVFDAATIREANDDAPIPPVPPWGSTWPSSTGAKAGAAEPIRALRPASSSEPRPLVRLTRRALGNSHKTVRYAPFFRAGVEALEIL